MTKVPSNRRCCGCVNLRTGCLILTYFQMIGGLVLSLLVVILLALLRSTQARSFEGYSVENIRMASYILLGISIFSSIVGLLGVLGTYKSKPGLLLAYLIIDAVCIAGWFGGVIATFQSRNALWGIQFTVMLLLQIYFFIPVHQYRREIQNITKYVYEVNLKC
ncbi:hypothetical protein K493DRAFT_411558 [Basidiobolus meristosporus CBS 931.73]|uniref:Uncharacterized protein n=1 Tax=Basidiobolus meristosporus CBS 931.73 TaxID=1314790 RepID=A0A1Y1XFN8_9FUNG|nr:hypothetical protein K493DRAFT_411558 [Basidiobolus meristosporus CBS 931.73]|eukprot:ORX84512.1 hypothetical protein K493DRAFT_411558 [Basidiobolus meristosporus CBS 931.73]